MAADSTTMLSRAMSIPATQEDSKSWVEFAFTGGKAESSLIPSLCCVYTTNLSTSGFPEILAVDCEAIARETVQQVITYMANYMINSDMVVPDRLRFTLAMENPLCWSYFSSLQVTDATQVTTLCENYLNGAISPKGILLLMPIVPRGDAFWGQLPTAPENKARTRDHIKRVLADQAQSPCGFLRVLSGNSTRKIKSKSKKSKNAESVCVGRVKLSEALKNPDWKVMWDEELKPRDIEYMKKNSRHFLAMSIDGIGRGRAKKYIGAVCDSADNFTLWYKEGKMIENSVAALVENGK